MRRLIFGLCLMGGVLSAVSPALAGDGDVDTSWGGTGVVRLGISDYDWVQEIATYGSSGVEVAGSVETSGLGTGFDTLLLMRFRTDGTLDTTCNGSGYTMLTTPDRVSTSDMTVLPDGSTVMVATIESTLPQGMIVKYTPTCALDQGFGVGGIVTYTDRLGVRFSTVDTDGNGSIVVGGTTYFAPVDGGDSRFTVIRTDPSGQFDTSFGVLNNGVFVSDGTHEGRVNDLLVDPAGRVVFVGVQNKPSDDDAVIGRLSITGVPDQDFAGSGWYSRGDGDDETLYSIATRPGGGVVAVGGDFAPLTPLFLGALVCLTANGSPDTSCGVPGPVVGINLPNGSVEFQFWSVVVDDSGRFVIAGYYIDPTLSGGAVTPMVIRLLPDGSPDPTFGVGGLVTAPFAPAHATDIALDQSGRILVGGHEFTQNATEGPVSRLAASTTTTTTSTTTTIPTPATSVPIVTVSTVSVEALPDTGSPTSTLPFALLATGIGTLVILSRRRSNIPYHRG